MTGLEAMAYKMQPAGHEEPPKRREYQQSNPALATAFYEWLKYMDEKMEPGRKYGHCQKFAWDEYHEHAKLLLKGVDATSAEANALLFAYSAKEFPEHYLSGLFLSAVYNKSPEKTIFFDVKPEQMIAFVGFRLPEDKTLLYFGEGFLGIGQSAEGTIVNFGKAGNAFGNNLSGLCINCNQAGTEFGNNSSGVILNYGTAGENMGKGAIGTVIGFADPKSFGIAKNHIGLNMYGAQVLNANKIKQIEYLNSYLKTLKERLEVVGKTKKPEHFDAKTISHDIEKMILTAHKEGRNVT